jgi:hypothetical protein
VDSPLQLAIQFQEPHPGGNAGCHSPWVNRMQLVTGCEVEYGEAERAFMVGERVVHDGVG